jgi:hypothetical protein
MRVESRIAGAVLVEMNNQYWPIGSIKVLHFRLNRCSQCEERDTIEDNIIWSLLGSSRQQEFAVDKDLYFASSILCCEIATSASTIAGDGGFVDWSTRRRWEVEAAVWEMQG